MISSSGALQDCSIRSCMKVLELAVHYTSGTFGLYRLLKDALSDRKQ